MITETNLSSWVCRLDGYLSAVSHLNDRVGGRHFFFAFELPENLENLREFLINHFKDEYININKIHNCIDSVRVFSDLVTRNIFKNLFFGDSLSSRENENFIKTQLSWHIEDYITVLETESNLEPECWLVTHSQELESETESMVFKFGDFSFIVVFSHCKQLDVILEEL